MHNFLDIWFLAPYTSIAKKPAFNCCTRFSSKLHQIQYHNVLQIIWNILKENKENQLRSLKINFNISIFQYEFQLSKGGILRGI